MIIAPFRAFIGTPLISMLTSSLMREGVGGRLWTVGKSSRRSQLFARYHAAAVLDEVFELGPEMFDETLDRPSGGIAECTNRMAFDLADDIEQHVDIGLLAL